MTISIYMESAYKNGLRIGVIHCEVILPEKGQFVLNKVLRDTTAQRLTREKALFLAELLESGIPQETGRRHRLSPGQLMFFSGDSGFWRDYADFGDSLDVHNKETYLTRNKDAFMRIVRVCMERGYTFIGGEKYLLHKLMRDEAEKYLEEVLKHDAEGKDS